MSSPYYEVHEHPLPWRFLWSWPLNLWPWHSLGRPHPNTWPFIYDLWSWHSTDKWPHPNTDLYYLVPWRFLWSWPLICDIWPRHSTDKWLRPNTDTYYLDDSFDLEPKWAGLALKYSGESQAALFEQIQITYWYFRAYNTPPVLTEAMHAFQWPAQHRMKATALTRRTTKLPAVK